MYRVVLVALLFCGISPAFAVGTVIGTVARVRIDSSGKGGRQLREHILSQRACLRLRNSGRQEHPCGRISCESDRRYA